MRSLSIPYLHFNSELSSAEHLSTLLSALPVQQVEEQPWPKYSYKPEVQFSIAYTDQAVLLGFNVHEEELRFVNDTPNSAVWEDSCVEFFIALDDHGYYNFEFNCIGTVLVGFGKNRKDRQLLPVTLVKRVACFSVTKEAKGNNRWQLLLQIPFSVFMYHPVFSLEGRTCKANFYKCGDKLERPHFLAWNRIDTAEPDFHQPDYFGEIEFAAKVL
jgi:hypothetical protein